MCGRYQFSTDASETLAQIAHALGRTEFAGEIFPSNPAPVLWAEKREIRPALLTWGFPIQTKRLIINARSETAAVKPMFRDSLKTRRCVIPSSGFYEWDAEKHKYLFQLPHEDTLYMAGIYSNQGEKSRFCILTSPANDSIKAVHDRMPLVLKKNRIHDWIFSDTAALDLINQPPPLLAKTLENTQLQLW